MASAAVDINTVDYRIAPFAQLLVIASAAVVWLVDRDAEVHAEFRYEGLVHSVREGAPGEVVASVYDVTNPSLPVVDYVLG